MVDGECGRFWRAVTRLQRIGRFWCGVSELPCSRFGARNAGIAAERIEFAIEGRATDVQSPRHLGHPSAAMLDGEPDGFGLNLVQGAQGAIRIEQFERGSGRCGRGYRGYLEGGRQRCNITGGGALTHDTILDRPCAESGHCRRGRLML